MQRLLKEHLHSVQSSLAPLLNRLNTPALADVHITKGQQLACGCPACARGGGQGHQQATSRLLQARTAPLFGSFSPIWTLSGLARPELLELELRAETDVARLPTAVLSRPAERILL